MMCRFLGWGIPVGVTSVTPGLALLRGLRHIQKTGEQTIQG